MKRAVLIRFSPAGPWRFGAADSGQDNQVEPLFRSDRFFSALTLAARQLGFLEEWLSATAESDAPGIACSSLFPFQGETLFVMPPATLWPPPPSQITAPSPVFLTKVRWTAAKFIPVALAETLLLNQKVLADQWLPDPESECLLRRDRPSTPPFRSVLRSFAAVDRLTHSSTVVHNFGGVEFEAGSGLWTVVRFADDDRAGLWLDRLEGMVRLMADTGLGGRKSAGWGQVQSVEFSRGSWPRLLFPKLARTESADSSLYWTLSLFSPGPIDQVDWTAGDYTVVERGSPTGLRSRFIAEGSVLSSASLPVGSAVNVANGQAAHAVYRSGILLALQLPAIHSTELEIVETTTPEDLLEDQIPLAEQKPGAAPHPPELTPEPRQSENNVEQQSDPEALPESPAPESESVSQPVESSPEEPTPDPEVSSDAV